MFGHLHLVIVLLIGAGGCPETSGAVQLPSFFSSSMVLQHDEPVAFWGLAAPGAAVTVTFGKVVSVPFIFPAAMLLPS